MSAVLPEPSRTVILTAAFTGLRVGELRGLVWENYLPPDDNTFGELRVLQSIWRGRVGTPKNKRSKAVVPVIPEVCAVLERHRAASGNPSSGPIFANGAGKSLDLDSLYQRQMKAPLRRVGIQWEDWHGFRRGLATNLETIGVRESIAAMILRHANERVTRKHYIKPAPVEAVSAMRQLSDTFSKPTAKLLPTQMLPNLRRRTKRGQRDNGSSKGPRDLNVSD